jgi:hypothetical protein
MPPPDPPTERADWTRRLFAGETPGETPGAPTGDGSRAVMLLAEASERITAHPAVQKWLREAGFEAARGLRGGDAMAQAQAHGRMARDLKEQFPTLVEAVREATGGCGELALQWRPLHPNYSKVYLSFFDGAFDPDVFCALRSPALSAVRDALRAVREALPKGEPFAGQPNEAAGVLEHDGRCLGVRYRERASEKEGRPRRSVALVPAPGDETDEHTDEQAARGVVAYFAPEERERWYER